MKFIDVKEPSILKKLLKKYKVIVLENYVGKESLIDYMDNFLNKIGIVLEDQDEDLSTGKQTGNKYIGISYDPKFVNLYRSSSNSQPLHTDFSYVNVDNNIQFLMCISAASFGGATTFIDSKKLIELMIFDDKIELLNKLKFFEVGFKKCDIRYKKTNIIKEINGDYKLNYNYQPFLRYDNNEEIKQIVEEFKDFLETKVEKSGLLTSVLLKPGDVVLFNDSLVLHGRNSYFAKNKGERTLIKGTLILDNE